MRSGIYKIINKQNNKFYIGSATNLSKRFSHHRHRLKNNKHYNKHLQNAWDKYGEQNFIFETIEECEKNKLIEREQYYLDSLKPEYNICLIAGNSLGLKRSLETRLKISLSNLGKHVHSQETLEKQSKCKIGAKNPMFGKHQDHPRAKLSAYEVSQIRELHITGNSYTKLAQQFNISKSSVADIIKGRCWND